MNNRQPQKPKRPCNTVAEQVVELALFLEKRGPDVLKIVTRAENEEQLLESFRAMRLLKEAEAL